MAGPMPATIMPITIMIMSSTTITTLATSTTMAIPMAIPMVTAMIETFDRCSDPNGTVVESHDRSTRNGPCYLKAGIGAPPVSDRTGEK